MPEHEGLAGILEMYASFALIENFASTVGVVVIGDAILDNFCHGVVERISPEAPIPVHRVTRDEYLLGGATNTAANLAALSVETTYCGIVGNDKEGQDIIRLLDSHNIARHVQLDDGYRTTLKTRYVTESHDGHQILRSDREEDLQKDAVSRVQLLEKLRKAASGANSIVVSDYGKGVVDEHLLKALMGQSSTIMLDPHPKNFGLYQKFPGLFHLVTPNHKEAAEMCNVSSRVSADDALYIKSLGQKLRKKLKTNIVITCGAYGAWLFEVNKKAVHIPAWEISKVFDVSGAGDTFIAALTLACVVSDVSLEEAVRFANFVASIVVQEQGTATVPRAKLEEVRLQSSQLYLSTHT